MWLSAVVVAAVGIAAEEDITMLQAQVSLSETEGNLGRAPEYPVPPTMMCYHCEPVDHYLPLVVRPMADRPVKDAEWPTWVNVGTTLGLQAHGDPDKICADDGPQVSCNRTKFHDSPSSDPQLFTATRDDDYLVLQGGRHFKYCSNTAHMACNSNVIGDDEKFNVHYAGDSSDGTIRIVLKQGDGFCAEEGNKILCKKDNIEGGTQFKVWVNSEARQYWGSTGPPSPPPPRLNFCQSLCDEGSTRDEFQQCVLSCLTNDF